MKGKRSLIIILLCIALLLPGCSKNQESSDTAQSIPSAPITEDSEVTIQDTTSEAAESEASDTAAEDSEAVAPEKNESAEPSVDEDSAEIPASEPETDNGSYASDQAGDLIEFGHYEQDNDPSNGQETIEWIVLAKEQDRMLVISRYGLDAKPYNKKRTDITWETCTLRNWLNDEFYNTAFTEEEREAILDSYLTAEGNPNYSTEAGNDTTDKVFLLSVSEVESYFSTDEAMQCQPTAYAIAQGAWTSEDTEYYGNCNWWLRSPGSESYNASNVSGAGGGVHHHGNGVYMSTGAVRPAIWISLK